MPTFRNNENDNQPMRRAIINETAPYRPSANHIPLFPKISAPTVTSNTKAISAMTTARNKLIVLPVYASQPFEVLGAW